MLEIPYGGVACIGEPCCGDERSDKIFVAGTQLQPMFGNPVSVQILEQIAAVCVHRVFERAVCDAVAERARIE